MSDSVTGREPREVLAYALMVAKGANSLQYDDADIIIAAIQREVLDPYARLVVDPYDVDQALYLNDPIYKGIAYRLHRGTPKSRPVHETGDPRPYGSDRDDPEW